jgi:hypothetical protein
MACDLAVSGFRTESARLNAARAMTSSRCTFIRGSVSDQWAEPIKARA